MDDRPNSTDALRVCKRDGSVEPFVIAKLLNCIRNGFQGCGETVSAGTSRGLAEAVQEFLKRTNPKAPVPSQQISELTDIVLTQTDHTAACMAIRQHSYLREQQRRRVVVASPASRDGRYVHRRWNKGRLVRHLQKKHRLERPAARMIAGRIEPLILNCGLRVVTAGLVREMTHSELMAWGLLPAALVVRENRGGREARKVKDNSDLA